MKENEIVYIAVV